MTLLDDDLTAYITAATPPDGDPLTKLLTDIVDALNTTAVAIHAIGVGIATLEETAGTATATIEAFKQFEANVLAAGIGWNPARLSQLADEGITPTSRR